MLTEILNQLNEFIQLDAQKRAILVSYGVLIFIIVIQYKQIENFQEKENNVSQMVHESLKKNQELCDDLLKGNRLKYQEELEKEKDKYQNVVDSLTDKVTKFQRQIQSDNIKLQKLL